jgi:uncharacterized membrane protein YphA (DoxX/SURF4 family)
LRKEKTAFSPVAPLLIRVTIGFYFFLLGLWAYLDPDLSRLAVQKYSGFSPELSGLYTTVATYVFFAIGPMLVAGLLTKKAALIGAIMLLPLFCGAGMFNGSENNLAYFLEKRSLYRDLVIFAGCLSLALTGPGALSMDGIFTDIYGK